ncbi:MAG: hypothetical protein JO139_07105 [Alphaproteobacteria bacterium]|nr:hypothetical protein [Alphaproteobacteria bacterium]MBV8337677.1 hypothetical protein [Alphaproteobacteria bacterium]
MARANIHYRATLERVYPFEGYASDAAQNSLAQGQVVRGVLILSGPDTAGTFEVEPASRHVGETAGAAFLAPQRRDGGSGDIDQRASYKEFLDEIVAAARRFGFEPEQAPGRNDPRIRGLRQ